MAFLFSGTTTTIATALEADRREQHDNHQNGVERKPQTAQALIGALQLSSLVGVGLGASIFLFAPQFLAAIVGGGTLDPSILGAAMKYVKIRALGMPAAAMLGSAQTACLAQRDVRMPLYATMIAAASNLILDVCFIRNPHVWLGGAAGAAWATVGAQFIAAGWVMRWLLSTNGGNKSRREDLPSKRSSTRGFLADRMRMRDLLKLPSKRTSKAFSPFVLPVITTQVGRCSASAAMDHVISSSLGTASMAAHQIIGSMCLGPVPVADSLSLAAQNFVPRISEHDNNAPNGNDKKAAEQSFAMRKLLQSFAKAAGLCGLTLAAIMGTLPPVLHGIFRRCSRSKDRCHCRAVFGIDLLEAWILLCFRRLLVGQKAHAIPRRSICSIYPSDTVYPAAIEEGSTRWINESQSFVNMASVCGL